MIVITYRTSIHTHTLKKTAAQHSSPLIKFCSGIHKPHNMQVFPLLQTCRALHFTENDND